GENPHQKAAYYTDPEINVTGVASASQLHGKELSFNNILDLEAAFETVKEFEEPAACVIKHTNPCGVAVSDTLSGAFSDAWDSDPVSAFGSIIGFNQNVDVETARRILDAGFVECIIAPRYELEALEILKSRKNLRILETGRIKREEIYDFDMKRVVGGILIQERDLRDFGKSEIKCVTEKSPTEEELEALIFAWKVCKHVKSNAIVLANGKKTVGIGAGQMSRVDATFMAIHKAGERAQGAVLASDAFFPQPDSVELAAKHGIKAIIQPGGSVKDEDVIEACNKTGISMIFTGIRHFRH
ncbi:MAG: bifunctional phosphoribosylaminoimidazolecarboxamide formyltransferase/IMP cyclohydrolase PurH, partial [Spirochaetes bacterium]